MANNGHRSSSDCQDSRIRECSKRDALFRDHAKLQAHVCNVIIHALSLIRVTPHWSPGWLWRATQSGDFVAMESKCFDHSLDEQLIDLVRMHPALYQSSHISYKENAVKESVWDEIAMSLDRTGNTV